MLLACNSLQARTAFSTKNIQTLQVLDGANVLIDVCLELTYLKRYQQRYLQAVNGNEFIMPTSMGEAVATRNS